MATTRLMTAEEFELLEDGGQQYELIRGEVVATAPAGRRSSRLGLAIGARLLLHVKDHGLGEVYGADAGFILARDPDVVLAPDTSFVRGERLQGLDQDHFLPLSPDLAVEVISPSDRAAEITKKAMAYLAAGTLLVWVIHPVQRTVTVYTLDRTAHVLGEHDTLNGGDVLPEFRLPIVELFA